MKMSGTKYLLLCYFITNRGRILQECSSYEFDFWTVHGIMNTSGLLQSK